MTKFTFYLEIYSESIVCIEIPVHADTLEEATRIIEEITKSTKHINYNYELV